MTRIVNTDWINYKEFYHYDDKDGHTVIHDDAPEVMKKNYEAYLKEIEAAEKRGTL